MRDYHALYEFMSLLSNMLEWYQVPGQPNVTYMSMMDSFLYSFACRAYGDVSNPAQVLIGTGGRLYEGLLRLLACLPPLHSLGLRNLRLERQDVGKLLIPVLGNVGEYLITLEV